MGGDVVCSPRGEFLASDSSRTSLAYCFWPRCVSLAVDIPVGAYTSDVAPRSMSGKSGDGVAIPPLSQTTLREFACNTTGEIWNELLVLARQPGVVNLGQGYPDYDGSKVAREAAAEAMVDPTKVIIWHLRNMRNRSSSSYGG